VFYLNSPDASTSSLLIDLHGFDPHSCYVANRHASSNVLRRMLPPENLIHASAAKALMPPNGRSRDHRDDATAVVFVKNQRLVVRGGPVVLGRRFRRVLLRRVRRLPAARRGDDVRGPRAASRRRAWSPSRGGGAGASRISDHLRGIIRS